VTVCTLPLKVFKVGVNNVATAYQITPETTHL